MCGRYVLYTEQEVEDIKQMLREIEDRYKNQEVFPTNVAPVLVADKADAYKAQLMTWGFPQYKGSGVVINARSETVFEKPMFKNAITSRRCIVPASGYFEWTGPARAKTKHLIRVLEQPLFMAGCYSVYRSDNGDEKSRFVILTTDANDTVKVIHNRMPVVLLPEELSQWLHGDVQGLFDRSRIRLEHRLSDSLPLL